jgi:hypothetical protein
MPDGRLGRSDLFTVGSATPEHIFAVVNPPPGTTVPVKRCSPIAMSLQMTAPDSEGRGVLGGELFYESELSTGSGVLVGVASIPLRGTVVSP